MRFLTITFIFLASFAIAETVDQVPEFPLDQFDDWAEDSSSHNSPLWVVSSLEQAENMLENHAHSEDDIQLQETHYLNSSGDRAVYLICEPNEEGCENLLMSYFTREADGEGSLISLYTKNSEKNVWELIPATVYPGGTYREFAEYMHEKLGRYIIFHG